ncbi:MAG: hypothetical protein Q6368_003050 [Candidatus Baldrarchaeota archaeon]
MPEPEAVTCPACSGGFRKGVFTHCPHCGIKLPPDIAKKEEQQETLETEKEE